MCCATKGTCHKNKNIYENEKFNVFGKYKETLKCWKWLVIYFYLNEVFFRAFTLNFEDRKVLFHILCEKLCNFGFQPNKELMGINL